ncbi:MAG: GAF domain-containing protein [Methanosarcinales archaeon]
MKRDYQSSIAVPIIYNDMMYGALNVYSVLIDSFDEDEVRLLDEGLRINIRCPIYP